ncbi:Protein accellerated cell death 6 [Vitis vinifera]|uniref:Protein accellerated cell death 6 n=1 Tax=Vitis vinifera TaxID=29760 RepID=A0A438CCP8_VITVI|nr:Protein accellerated cell death 6 [Vitis vinifera]
MEPNITFMYDEKTLEKLLAMELVDQKDKHGRTSLHYAASIGYLEGVQTLLGQSNFDQYQRDDEGFSPIHVASMRGNVDIVKELLQVSSGSIELLGKHSENILHVAAKYGQTVFDIAVSVEHPTSFHQGKHSLVGFDLVATVTFAAGFTMPGGYNSSDPSAGMAIFLMRNMFHMFVICNTIAMYTSILVENVTEDRLNKISNGTQLDETLQIDG